MLKRLKNIEDKTDNQLDLIRDQGDKQLERIDRMIWDKKEVVDFYSGLNKKIKDLEARAKSESAENLEDNEKVFYVKIPGEPFNINRYTNLSYFGNKLFTGKISLREAKDEQRKIIKANRSLRKKIDPNKQDRPLNKANKKDAKELISNAKKHIAQEMILLARSGN